MKNARKAGDAWKHGLAALLLALFMLTAGASAEDSLEEGVAALPLLTDLVTRLSAMMP